MAAVCAGVASSSARRPARGLKAEGRRRTPGADGLAVPVVRVVRRRRGLGQRDGEAPELGALAVAPDARGPHLAERPRGPAALRRDQDELEDGRLVPALARRDDGDDVLRRGPRRGLRVGEGPRQREPRARDEGLGRRHVADAADDARAEHERAVLGPQLEAVLARPRHAAGHPVRSPRCRHGARRQQRGRHELVALAGLEGLEVLEGDRAHGALRGRRGLEAGQGEGRHAEARAEPRPSSEPAPKALPFASTTRALPGTGPGAPKRLRAGSRAALVPDWRLDEGRCWTRPRPADSQPRARSAAKLMRRRLSRVEAPFILSWGAAHTGPPRTSARAIPGAAPLRHGVAGSFWQEGERSYFVRLGGFLPSAGETWAQRPITCQKTHTRAGCTVATGWYALLCCPGDAGQRRACR